MTGLPKSFTAGALMAYSGKIEFIKEFIRIYQEDKAADAAQGPAPHAN